MLAVRLTYDGHWELENAELEESSRLGGWGFGQNVFLNLKTFFVLESSKTIFGLEKERLCLAALDLVCVCFYV